MGLVVEEMVGIVKVGWVVKSYGGNELGMEMRVVENGINE